MTTTDPKDPYEGEIWHRDDLGANRIHINGENHTLITDPGAITAGMPPRRLLWHPSDGSEPVDVGSLIDRLIALEARVTELEARANPS